MRNYQQEKKEEIINFYSRDFDEDLNLIGLYKYSLDPKNNTILSIHKIL